MGNFILPLLLFAGMYMLLIRPQQKRAKEQQALISSLEAGDRVLMTSGIYGTITEVLDVAVFLELAQGFEILVNRQAIQDRLTEFPTEILGDGDGDGDFEGAGDFEDTDEDDEA